MARKAYVKRHFRPIRDRVNELEALTAANSRMIRDVDGSAQQGIQLVSARITVADQHAIEAANKAQMAHLTATDHSPPFNGRADGREYRSV